VIKAAGLQPADNYEIVQTDQTISWFYEDNGNFKKWNIPIYVIVNKQTGEIVRAGWPEYAWGIRVGYVFFDSEEEMRREYERAIQMMLMLPGLAGSLGGAVRSIPQMPRIDVGRIRPAAPRPGQQPAGSAGDCVPNKPFSRVPPEQPPFDPSGTLGAAKAWTMKGRLKHAQLPTTGKIRFVPRANYNPSQPLPRGPNGGYLDRFGNERLRGPSRTPGQPFEWDVQIGQNATPGFRALSRDGKHVNVSLDGEVTH
jgi:filamentous hemagglutinin